MKSMLKTGVIAAIAVGAGLATAAAETPMKMATPKAAMSTPSFVKAASQSDEFEITEGKLAEKAGSPALQKFGEKMVRDHTKTTEELHAALKKAGMAVAPPPELTSEQTAMVDKLKRLTGREFDKTYLEQAVMSHKQALALHEGYDREGDSAPIVAASKGAVPIVKEHLRMAEHMAEGKSGAM